MILHPLRSLFRKKALQKNRPDTKPGIIPLSKVRSAAVIVDATAIDCNPTISAVNSFFSQYGIRSKVYAFNFTDHQYLSSAREDAVFLFRRNLNWYGAVRRKKRQELMDGNEELFINLLPENVFAAEFAARCSRAAFKIGRFQLKGELYDLVVTDSNGVRSNQEDVFKTIAGIISKVQ